MKWDQNRFARWAAGLLLVVTTIGCGEADQLEVYPVQGRVNFRGKPMAGGGSIAFIPVSGQEGKTAGGEIQEDGSYYLSTYGDGDGSIPGEFRVVITQVVESEPQAVSDGEGMNEAAPIANSGSRVDEADWIPPIYSDHRNSPLTARVEATDSNQLNFELKP